MKKIAAFYSGIAAVFLSGSLFAQQPERTHFLSHGPGSFEESLGGAAAACSMGPAAIYYNPAHLSEKSRAISSEYTKLLPGVSYTWLGSAFSLGGNNFALGVVSLDLGEIVRRQSLTDPGDSVKSFQRAYLLGFGKSLGGPWRAGAALGLLDYQLAGFSSQAHFADVGLAAFVSSQLKLGINLKNVYFSGLDLAGNREIYPPQTRLGASWTPGGMVLTTQIEKTLDGSRPRFAAGLGYSPIPLFSLRAGRNGYPRFGIGFLTKSQAFAVDVSWQMRTIMPTGRIGVTYFFKDQNTPAPGPVNPYSELRQRARSLSAYLIEESKRLIEEKKTYEARQTLKKFLALNPSDKKTRRMLASLKGAAADYPSIRWLPFALSRKERSKRRAYLRFAVHFAEDNWQECIPVARDFVGRWPEDKRAHLIEELVGRESGIFPRKPAAAGKNEWR